MLVEIVIEKREIEIVLMLAVTGSCFKFYCCDFLFIFWGICLLYDELLV